MFTRLRQARKLIFPSSILFFLLFPAWGVEKKNDYDKAVLLLNSKEMIDKEEALKILSLSLDTRAHTKLAGLAADRTLTKRLRILSIAYLGGLGKKKFSDDLKKIAIKDPDYEVSLMAAEALYMMGYKSALKFITDALEEKDKRIVIYAIERLAALRIDSSIYELDRLILKEEEKEEKDTGIIHKANKGIKIIKGELDYDKILKAQKKIDLSYRAKEKGDIDSAIKNAREALELDDSNEHAYWILGNIHAQMYEEKNKRLALDEFTKCLAFGFMDRGSLYFAIGSVYLDIHEYKEALINLEKASSLNPHEIVFYRLGQAYVQEKNISKAIDALKKALKANPQFTEGYCVLADLYNVEGNAKLHKAYMRQCKKLRQEEKMKEKM